MKLQLKFNESDLELEVNFNKYSSNGACCVDLFEDGEPYCGVTTNVPDHWKEIWAGTPSEDKYPMFPLIVIKDYSENEGIADALIEAGFIKGHVRLAQCDGMFKLASLTDEWIAEALKTGLFNG